MSIVAGKVLPKEKHIVIALTSIYGVGLSRAKRVCQQASVSETSKVKDVPESKIEAIRQVLAEYSLEGDLRRLVGSNISRLMSIGSYRGIRHRKRLPLRGQRTKTNAMTCKRRGRKAK